MSSQFIATLHSKHIFWDSWDNIFLNRNNLRNAPKVVFQAELEKLERELKKLNDQSAATSDKEEKSKLIERLSKVEK